MPAKEPPIPRHVNPDQGPSAMKKITKRQFEIVNFIRDFIGKNTISPTLYDITEYFSIKPSTAAAHIAALERKRVVVRQKGRRRSIRPVGMNMGAGLPQKVPVCIPFYLKNAGITGAPSSYYQVDASLLPENVCAKDLFAVRFGFFGGLLSEVSPGDILIVWTRPGRLHPGMIVLEQSGASPVCRQVAMDSDPGPEMMGQVIALLRSLS